MGYLDNSGFLYFWNKAKTFFAASLTATDATVTLKSKSGATLSSATVNNVATAANATNHINDKTNPHGVTKAQIGLSNVDNTADSVKSVAFALNANDANTVGGWYPHQVLCLEATETANRKTYMYPSWASWTSGYVVSAYSDTTKSFYPIWVAKSGVADTAASISQRKYKENIVDISQEAAKKLLQLTPVTFDYTEKAGGAKNQAGLIYEDTVPLIRQAGLEIKGDAIDGEQVHRLNYVALVPYLIKLCQTQQAEIDALKQDVENIKEK